MRMVQGIVVAAGLALAAGCVPQGSSQTVKQQAAADVPAADSATADPDPDQRPQAVIADSAVKPAAASASPDAASPTSDAEVRPAGLRPRADRGKTPEGVEKITFDDLILGMQADMVFRPWMLESETNGGRAKELEGQRVRLSGIMHGGVESTEKNTEFVLLRNKECKFGPGGQADHLAKVFMKKGETAPYTGDGTVRVEGTLRIKPSMGIDGNTWSIYELEEAELK